MIIWPRKYFIGLFSSIK